MRGGGSNNIINEQLNNEKKIPRGYDRILCIYYTSNTSNTLTNPTITSHYIKENNTDTNDLKYEFNDKTDETNVKRVTLRKENEENLTIVDSLIKYINPESSNDNEGSNRVEQEATEVKQGNAEEKVSS